MIRIRKAAVASSTQDGGRVGYRTAGYARSGAMDHESLVLANRLAGATDTAAGIELGPGGCSLEVTRRGTIAFGGARRHGAPWWETLPVEPGAAFDLSPPRDGVWSYIALEGGVDAPLVRGSRSTSVREGIGRWLAAGDVVGAGSDTGEPRSVDPPPMTGEIRLYGSLPGGWRAGSRLDRMGYVLDGTPLGSASPSEWSEPLLPGFVQVPPGGMPIVLMAEGPTVGGYRVAAIVHSKDLRFVAQTRSGGELRFIPG